MAQICKYYETIHFIIIIIGVTPPPLPPPPTLPLICRPHDQIFAVRMNLIFINYFAVFYNRIFPIFRFPRPSICICFPTIYKLFNIQLDGHFFHFANFISIKLFFIFCKSDISVLPVWLREGGCGWLMVHDCTNCEVPLSGCVYSELGKKLPFEGQAKSSYAIAGHSACWGIVSLPRSIA